MKINLWIKTLKKVWLQNNEEIIIKIFSALSAGRRETEPILFSDWSVLRAALHSFRPITVLETFTTEIKGILRYDWLFYMLLERRG